MDLGTRFGGRPRRARCRRGIRPSAVRATPADGEVSHDPIVYLHRVLNAPAVSHYRVITAWDPARRRLRIDGRRLWVAPTVAVFGVLDGTLVTASGHQEDPSARWMVTDFAFG